MRPLVEKNLAKILKIGRVIAITSSSNLLLLSNSNLMKKGSTGVPPPLNRVKSFWQGMQIFHIDALKATATSLHATGNRAKIISLILFRASMVMVVIFPLSLILL